MLTVSKNMPPAVVEMSKELYSKFLTEPIIEEYVSLWHSFGKASKNELFAYLDSIHFYSIDVITKTLINRGLFRAAPPRNEEKYEYQLRRVKLFTETFKISSPEKKKEVVDKYVLTHNEQSLLNRYKNRDKAYPPLFLEIIGFPEKYCTSLEESVFPEWYVACFMEDCDDSAIWGTYGKNHEAVCLEFNIETKGVIPGLTLNRPNSEGSDGIGWSDKFTPFHPVSYDKEFASVDFFNSLGSISFDSAIKYWLSDGAGRLSVKAKKLTETEDKWRSTYWDNFNHTATVKSSHWEKEREFRLIQSSNIIDISEPTLRKLKFKFASLKGIVFGIKTPTEDKYKLITKIAKLCIEHKRENFDFYQARYNHTTKKVTRDLLTSIKVGYLESKSSQ
jgi:hypothetical protein